MKLLSYLGPSVILRSEHLDTIYSLLEKRLSDDPIIEVRYQLGTTMRELKLFDRVYQRMIKFVTFSLQNPNLLNVYNLFKIETWRARTVILGRMP